MAYGINFVTANGNVQIDSTTTNTGLIVLSSALSSQSVTFDQQKEICFARPASTTYTGEVRLALSNVTGTGTKTYYFEEPDGTRVNTNYIVGKWANEQIASSGGYGVQIFNSDGDLAYDTGLYTGDGGLGITAFWAAWQLSGYGSTGTTSKMTTDPTLFVNMNGTLGQASEYATYYGYVFKNSAAGTPNSNSSGPGIYWEAVVRITVFGNSNFVIGNFTPRFLAEGGSV
mgnify:CR=1 FL=1|tara:strand:+ start:146 stop:832 length:687 start_codon:yes stop_codon:yes gene_type:complete